MNSTSCATCRRRIPEHPAVCDRCRRNIDHNLRRIPGLVDALPSMLEPGSSTGQRVSGTREAPLPLRADVLDLALPAGNPAPVADPHGDQTGHVPIAARLDAWARDWRDTLHPDQHLPLPTVPELARWLRNRAQLAADQHPAIDEFAAELQQILADLHGALGLVEPAPQWCRGVECDRCDLRLLYRRADGSGDVECHNPDCRRVMRAGEYDQWTKRLATFHGKAAA